MKSNNNKYMGLPWLLAESLRSQIFNIQGTLNARTNLTSLIYSITAAILEADSTKLANADSNLMDNIEDSIDQLRQNYEPIMDNPESIDATVQKRTTYEQLLDLTTKNLMFIIHKYSLVDASLIQEGNARTWNEIIR